MFPPLVTPYPRWHFVSPLPIPTGSSLHTSILVELLHTNANKVGALQIEAAVVGTQEEMAALIQCYVRPGLGSAERCGRNGRARPGTSASRTMLPTLMWRSPAKPLGSP